MLVVRWGNAMLLFRKHSKVAFAEKGVIHRLTIWSGGPSTRDSFIFWGGGELLQYVLHRLKKNIHVRATAHRNTSTPSSFASPGTDTCWGARRGSAPTFTRPERKVHRPRKCSTRMAYVVFLILKAIFGHETGVPTHPKGAGATVGGNALIL